MQAAIIEINHNQQLIAYNDKAIELFGSTSLILNQPFDYQIIFNLKHLDELEQQDDLIIVLNSQYFLLQKVVESSKIVFIVQSIEYLKSH